MEYFVHYPSWQVHLLANLVVNRIQCMEEKNMCVVGWTTDGATYLFMIFQKYKTNTVTSFYTAILI